MTTTFDATGMSGSRTPTSTAVATTSTMSTPTMMKRLRLRFSRSSGGRTTGGGKVPTVAPALASGVVVLIAPAEG